MSKPENVNACYNRPPFKATLLVQTGWLLSKGTGLGTYTREPVMKKIPNPNSRDCQYSLTTRDPKCGGCKWNQGATP